MRSRGPGYAIRLQACFVHVRSYTTLDLFRLRAISSSRVTAYAYVASSLLSSFSGVPSTSAYSLPLAPLTSPVASCCLFALTAILFTFHFAMWSEQS